MAVNHFRKSDYSVKLRHCPCGKWPSELIIAGDVADRVMTVQGNCCGEWQVEMRFLRDDLKREDIEAAAVKAWNGATRSTP